MQMPKKFFDIIPPVSLPKKLFAPEKPVKPKRRIFLKTIIFCLVFLFLIGVSVFFFFSKIKIEIWPETKNLNLKAAVAVNPEVEEPDLKNGIIPVELLEDLRFASEEFPASGKALKEDKAKGIIRVYNAYSTSSRVLIPSRFVSTDGKLFRSVEKMVIPGGRYEKGKLIPGEADVEVEAAESGEEYNIGPSTFALPALAGTSLYTTIYGKSFSAMTGGFKGEVAQATEEDLKNAENVLTERLKRESKEFLEATLAKGTVLLNETIRQEIVEASSSVEPLAKTESFSFQAKVKSEGLGFKKSDIENFAKNLIDSASEGRKLQEESLEINYLAESIDLETKTIVLNLEIRAKVYSDVELTELKKALFGKSLKESKIFLGNLTKITKVEIKYWPFWKRRAPENVEKIEIKLNLDPWVD